MPIELGLIGVWRFHWELAPELAVEAEKLGYGAVWIGGSPDPGLELAESLLDATERMAVATGIVNMWQAEAATVAASYHRLEGRHPGRFLLGVGIGHPEAVKEYQRPYDKIVGYLDELDEAGVPADRRILAALGPKVLELAAERTAGAHPYLTPPAHTAFARKILGDGPRLAPEQKVVLETDPELARSIGRPKVKKPYLGLRNYRQNLLQFGFDEGDLADGGSDRLIDTLALHGDAETVAGGIRAHLDAGADHVGVQVLGDDPLPAYRALAGILL